MAKRTGKKTTVIAVILAVIVVAAVMALVVKHTSSNKTGSSDTANINSISAEDLSTERETKEDDVTVKVESGTATEVSSTDVAQATRATQAADKYMNADINTMAKELDIDPDAAKSKYINKQIRISGKLMEVSGNRNYLILQPSTGNGNIDEIPFTCYISGSAMQDKAENLQIGSTVTVCGTVSYIGALSGYELQADSIA